MKFLNIYLIKIITLAALVSGCSKEFLDLNNPQALPLEGTIVDAKTLSAASTGAYIPFRDINYYNRTFTLLPDLMSDNVFISRSNSGRYLAMDNFTVTVTDGYVSGAWNAMFRVINNANLAIAGGEKLIPNTEINQYIGEMYAIRALAHFDAVRLFAQPYNFTNDASHLGIPVITAPSTQIIFPKRETVKTVYDQIINDFNKALSLLSVHNNPGKMTPAAVNALLSKVYLYKEDWEQAEVFATNAINSNHNLISTANYVASWTDKFTTESIFEIANTPTSNAASDGIGYFYEQAGYGDGLATGDLYNLYSSTDIRRNFIQVGVRRATFENPAYFIKKYPKGNSQRDDNLKVIRLSEVYLIRAEARAELGKTNNAKTTLAQQDLNTIVKRADPAATDITLSGNDLIERILVERRKELAFEGHRLFDLNRRKKNVNNIRSDETLEHTYPNNRFIMPIPFAEMNTNSNMVQNPGWF